MGAEGQRKMLPLIPAFRSLCSLLSEKRGKRLAAVYLPLCDYLAKQGRGKSLF